METVVAALSSDDTNLENTSLNPIDFSSRVKEQLEAHSTARDRNPHHLIEILKQHPRLSFLFEQSARVREGYTIEEHTELGLDRLCDIGIPKCSLSREEFTLMYALHDIGKGVAEDLKEHAKKSWEIIESIREILPFEEKNLPLISALVLNNPIGPYLMSFVSKWAPVEERDRLGKLSEERMPTLDEIKDFQRLVEIKHTGTEDESVRERIERAIPVARWIHKQAEELSIAPAVLLKLFMAFYQTDTSAYTCIAQSHSKERGRPGLEYIYDVLDSHWDGKLFIPSYNGERSSIPDGTDFLSGLLKFSPQVEIIMSALIDAVESPTIDSETLCLFHKAGRAMIQSHVDPVVKGSKELQRIESSIERRVERYKKKLAKLHKTEISDVKSSIKESTREALQNIKENLSKLAQYAWQGRLGPGTPVLLRREGLSGWAPPEYSKKFFPTGFLGIGRIVQLRHLKDERQVSIPSLFNVKGPPHEIGLLAPWVKPLSLVNLNPDSLGRPGVVKQPTFALIESTDVSKDELKSLFIRSTQETYGSPTLEEFVKLIGKELVREFASESRVLKIADVGIGGFPVAVELVKLPQDNFALLVPFKAGTDYGQDGEPYDVVHWKVAGKIEDPCADFKCDVVHDPADWNSRIARRSDWRANVDCGQELKTIEPDEAQFLLAYASARHLDGRIIV